VTLSATVGLLRFRYLALAATLALLAGCGEEQPKGGAQPSSGQSPTPIAQSEKLPAPQAEPAADVPVGKGFDFYVLALLWSPSYCAAEGEGANQQQCSRPYGFAVHGLWPQFETGWPQDCKTLEPDVSQETLRSLYDIIPSAGLIRYQWRKHGACAGLAQSDYWHVLRSAWERVTIPAGYDDQSTNETVEPDKIERAFLAANPGLPANGAAVICDEEYFREIRICMTKELKYRSCPEVDRRDCRLKTAEMPGIGQ
jgi:ribonuclease T2